jgi:uncharacterized lipoprotein YddW (UPF0748 family)
MNMRTFFMAALFLPAVLFAAARPPQLPEVRAVWVTRFDYKTPLDVASIVANCKRAGFTDIFFQVRGNGTAFYPSRVEPWAFELTGSDVTSVGKNPGWDPLQMAAGWARHYGVRLHAYINVLPGWRGVTPPPDAAGQLWTKHPDWFMVDSTGTLMKPTSAWYSFLNPAHPGVRKHLSSIASELAAYDVAGLHLDYIRFPYDYKDVAGSLYPKASREELQAHSVFSFDPVSLSVMRKNASRQDWDRFRRESVTQVVSDLRSAFAGCREGRDGIVSASVLADFSTGYHKAFQDSRTWVGRKLVDWVVPMNYNASLYEERLALIRKALGRRRTGRSLIVGINCDAEPTVILRQIRAARKAGCRGFALFAYSHLFESHRPTEKASILYSQESARR